MGRWLDGGEELREGEAVGEEFDFVGVGLVDGPPDRLPGDTADGFAADSGLFLDAP